MRSTLLVLVPGLVLGLGCGHGSPPPAASPAPAPVVSPLLAAVGAKPRGFAILSSALPPIQGQLEELETGLRKELGKSPSDCGVALAKLERIRIAIGEPLRIAAEIDGPIDTCAVTCLAGGAAMAGLAREGLVIRDRPGGIAVEYQSDRTQAERARAVGRELARRCAEPSCAAIALGPSDRRLWVQLQIGKTFRLELSGPSLGHGAAALVAAIDQLRAANPALNLLTVREQQGALVVEMPADPPVASTVAMALTLRGKLLEAFKIPSSSMVPTLLVDDHVFVAKGPLLGEPAPGDLLVYNQVLDQEPRAWVKRYLAGPGQTIAETEAGISIDGKLLATEVLDPAYHYRDRDEATDRVLDRSGTLVREHLGARSYLTLRTGPPNQAGTWTVPADHVFFLGDSRNNSNDSRYLGASPNDAIVGRVVGIWLAYHDGVLDWDRMGVPVE